MSFIGKFRPKLFSTIFTNRNRGESGAGTWTLIVRDTKVNDDSGKFVDWHLKLWGESIDASKATLLPMPNDDDDADHDVTSTATPTAGTTSLPLPTDATDTTLPTALPSDHPERPVKPSKTTGESVATETGTETAAAESSTATSSWLPSFLPTFGVSSSTQAWIYGSIGLIVAFCAGLGAWFWFVRRKQRLNNPRDDYEFEPLTAGDGGDDNLGPATGEKGQKRRGGELYDAFAGGSEDEDEAERDHFDIASRDSDSDEEDDSDDDDERRAANNEKQQTSRLLDNGR